MRDAISCFSVPILGKIALIGSDHGRTCEQIFLNLLVYCDEHFLKLVLNCCVTGPELLRAMLIYISAQQFRTRNAAIQDQL